MTLLDTIALRDPSRQGSPGADIQVLAGDHPACGIVKRSADVILALVAIVVLLPVLLAVALVVRLGSPGPVLFRQERVGRGGRTFRVLKFRTMEDGTGIDAHTDHVARVLAGGDTGPVRPDGLNKLLDESRLVPFGRFLRRYSLDELPQLFNVVRGDMSLVGPRPTLAVELALCPAAAVQRLAVRPGMTGLWQVKGRNRLSFGEMFALDREYVERWTPALDLAILFRTVPAVLRRETT